MPGTQRSNPWWEGAVNARLLAGDIYRMGRSEWLTERGWQQMYDDGVRTVIDLRNPAERQRRPSDPGVGEEVLAGFTVVQAPTEDPEDPRYKDLFAPYMNHPRLYSPMVALFPDRVAAVFKELAAAQGSVVIHCSAGRDRTGLIATLLLTLLGQESRVTGEDELATRGINDWHLVAPVKHPYERHLEATEIAQVVCSRGEAVRAFVAGRDVRAFLLNNKVTPAEIATVVARCS